ncbi:MAG: SpoIIE family protein phosphatase [Bacteroidetes bacterium]|nr:SpoIIE family protein phosphatase [Bacteroidota bacterium]
MTLNTSISKDYSEIDKINDKSYEYRHDNPSLSLSYAQEALKLSEEKNYEIGKANSHLNSGFYYLNKGEHNLSIENFLNALYICKDVHYDSGIAEAKYNLGVLNFRLGNYDIALTQINESLTIRKDLHENKFLGKCYYQMAVIQYQLQDFEGALKATKKAMRFETQFDHLSGIAAIVILEGRIYTDMELFKEAEICLKEGYQRRLDLKEKIGIASIIFYLIELWMKQNLFEKAKEEMELHGHVFDEIEFPYGLAQSKQLQARIAMQMGDNDQVMRYLGESLLIAEKHQLREQISRAYLLYADYFEKNNQLELSLEYFKKYHQTKVENNEAQSEKILENIRLNNDIEYARKKADILRNANQQLIGANQVISEMNQNLKSSISYAKRIQEAVFPDQSSITQFFPKHLLIHKPKDIVSGDFIWIKNILNSKYVAVADCTGHGVPGAMLSMYANNVLSKCKFAPDSKPAEILDYIRTNFVADLISESVTLKDGMDIALIKIQGYELTFSGAYRPIYILRQKELIEIRGDRQPVGQFLKMRAFTNVSFHLKPGDQVVMFTDGISDQMGGVKNKKLKVSGLKEWLLEIGSKPIEIQQMLLEQKLMDWQGDNELTDDQLFFSFTVH